MNQLLKTSPSGAKPGVTIVEYSILISLIAIAGFASLQLLGASTSDAIQQSATQLNNTGGTLGVLKAIPRPAVVATNSANSSSSGIRTDQASGQPAVNLEGMALGVATNVSSIDGNSAKVLQSAAFAQYLSDLATNETNPTLKGYYQALADKTYYLGGVEGDLGNVSGLEAKSFSYSDSAALRDIQSYKKSIAKLIASPPANMNPEVFRKIQAMAQNTINIANTYPKPPFLSGLLTAFAASYDKQVNLTDVKQVASGIINSKIAAPAAVRSTFTSAASTDAGITLPPGIAP